MDFGPSGKDQQAHCNDDDFSLSMYNHTLLVDVENSELPKNTQYQIIHVFRLIQKNDVIIYALWLPFSA